MEAVGRRIKNSTEVLTAEAAILKAVEEQGVTSSVNAGLSLGEYGALIASGVMSEKDAFVRSP